MSLLREVNDVSSRQFPCQHETKRVFCFLGLHQFYRDAFHLEQLQTLKVNIVMVVILAEALVVTVVAVVMVIVVAVVVAMTVVLVAAAVAAVVVVVVAAAVFGPMIWKYIMIYD